MLVGERMIHSVISVGPDVPVMDALEMLRREHIRRAPVVENGKLVGIVSENDLRNASPGQATTLSVWEINYLVSKITVRKVMTKEVVTTVEDTPIEEAARILLPPPRRGSHHRAARRSGSRSSARFPRRRP